MYDTDESYAHQVVCSNCYKRLYVESESPKLLHWVCKYCGVGHCVLPKVEEKSQIERGDA